MGSLIGGFAFLRRKRAILIPQKLQFERIASRQLTSFLSKTTKMPRFIALAAFLVLFAFLAIPSIEAQTASFAYVSSVTFQSTDCTGNVSCEYDAYFLHRKRCLITALRLVVVTTLVTGSCTDPAVVSTLGTCQLNGTDSIIRSCSSDPVQKPAFPTGTTGTFGVGITWEDDGWNRRY
jgi:hypothetical protein